MTTFQQDAPNVGFAATNAPLNEGTDFTQLGKAATAAAGFAGRADGAKAAKAEAEATRALSLAAIHSQRIERQDEVSDAVQEGFFAPTDVAEFDRDITASIAALDQASARGMSGRVRESIQRNLLFQHYVMKYPGSEIEMAKRLGIDLKDTGAGSLAKQEQEEQAIVAASAKQAEEVLNQYGLQRTPGLTNEEFLEEVAAGPVGQHNLRLKQDQKTLASDQVSVELKTIPATRLISNYVADSVISLQDKIDNAIVNGNLSTTGKQQLINQHIAEAQAELSATFTDHPDQVKAGIDSITGIMRRSTRLVDGTQRGVDENNNQAAFDRQVMRHLKRAQAENNLAISNNRIGMLPVENSRLQLQTTEQFYDTLSTANKTRKEGQADPWLQRYLPNDETFNYEYATIMNEGRFKGNTSFLKLVDPERGNAVEAADRVNGIIVGLAHDEGYLANNPDAAAFLVENWDSVQANAHPDQQRAITASMMDLRNSPGFREKVRKSPVFRKMARPMAQEAKRNFTESITPIADELIGERSYFVGGVAGLTSASQLWAQMGPYVSLDVVDGEVTWGTRPGIENILTPSGIAKVQSELPFYNRQLRNTGANEQLSYVMDFEGSNNPRETLSNILRTSIGGELTNFDPLQPAPAVVPGSAAAPFSVTPTQETRQVPGLTAEEIEALRASINGGN